MNKIQEFVSATEASIILNINQSNISSVCRGVQKTYKGFIFRYK
jgi:hypothetical protein